MYDPEEEFRAGRAAPQRAGSLLAVAARVEDDPVARHGRARSRRERRPSPFLAAPPAAPELAESRPDQAVQPSLAHEPHVETPRETPPPRGLRERLAGWARSEEAPRHAEPEWVDAAPPQAAVQTVETVAHAAPAGARPARRPARTLLLMTAAGAAVGAAISLAWPSSYVATSEVLIDPRAAGAAGGQLSPEGTLAFVDNQIRVLRSGTMLGAVAERLNLRADPEFNGTGAFGMLAGLAELVGGAGDDTARARVTDSLSRSISVERVGGSTAISLSASTADPGKSALIANTVAELFAENGGGAPSEIGGADVRLRDLRAAVEEAERAVEGYKVENELVDAEGRLISDDEIRRLGEQLSDARARTAELSARAASTNDANVDSIVTGSLPEQFASPTLSELRARYADIKRDADRASVKLGPRHPQRLAAEAELEGARQGIGSELRRVAGAVQTELRRAVQHEQDLAAQLARMKVRQGEIGGEMVALRDLERTAEARRGAYEEALRIAQTGGSVSGAVSIISRAEAPGQATGPSLAGFTLAGAAAGLLAGAGLVARRRDGEAGDAKEIQDDMQSPPSGKEQEPMYPYPYQHAQAPAAPEHHGQAGHQQPHMAAAHPQPHAAATHQAPQPAPVGWQPPQPAPAWHPAPPQGWQQPQPAAMPQQPIAYYPQPQPSAPHPAMMAGWQPQPYPQMPMQPPHDPWAHLRGQMQPPAFAQPTYVPVAIIQQQPLAQPVAQAAPSVPPQPVEPHAERHGMTRERRRDERPYARHDHDRDHDRDHQAFVDDRTDEAIEEIRQSLRAFREAIEDIADNRESRRRYGT